MTSVTAESRPEYEKGTYFYNCKNQELAANLQEFSFHLRDKKNLLKYRRFCGWYTFRDSNPGHPD